MTAFVVSIVLTLIIVIWEWLENPGGIFHDQQGTNWHFVYDTAISWFVPTFIYVAIISAVLYFLLKLIQWFIKLAFNKTKTTMKE